MLCLVVLCWSMPVQASVNAQESDLRNPANESMEAEILQVLRDHPEVIWESLQTYQQQQRQRRSDAKNLLLKEFRTNPQQIIGESPTTGAVGQQIVLGEFSDFQCPYCAKVHKTLQQFMNSHQDEVILAYKHFPLTSMHPQAKSAAKAAWAAGQQGKFWPYHDALFTQQDELGEELYLDIAKNLNLNLERFNQDRNGNTANVSIQRDIDTARVLGAKGTPFFVMNGETFSGNVPLSKFEEVLTRVVQKST